MTDTDLAALRARHEAQAFIPGPDPGCSFCVVLWPCDAEVFARAMELTAKPLTTDKGFEVDMAALRNIEEMVGVYVGSSRAADLASDVVARLNLSGFRITLDATPIPATEGHQIVVAANPDLIVTTRAELRERLHETCAGYRITEAGEGVRYRGANERHVAALLAALFPAPEDP